MKKAIIHIGAHKTGSTAIQVVAYENARALQQAGINYPLRFARSNGTHWYGHHSIAFFLQGKKDAAESCCEAPDSLTADIECISRSEDLLLSSEVFSILKTEQIMRLRNLLAGFDFEILLYVRRQDEAAQALYQTDIVHYKASLDFDSYFKRKADQFDYYAIAQTWAEVFGKEKIHVRRYDRAQFPFGDVVQDFRVAVEHLIGRTLKAVPWTKSMSETNRGLPAHIVRMLAFYNGRKAGAPVVNAIAGLAYQLYEKGQGQYEIAPPSVRKAILEQFQLSNARLSQEFLGMSPMQGLFGDTKIAQTDAEWRAKHNYDGANLQRLAFDASECIRDLRQAVKRANDSQLDSPPRANPPDKRRYGSLHKIASTMSPREWAVVIGDATERQVVLGGIPLPDAPDPSIQRVFSNDSGKESILHTALPIYEYAMRHVHGLGIKPRRLMDFGCGWGRITRLFLRDVSEAGLYGVDPWDEAIQLARTHMPYACFVKSEVDPPLQFSDNYFDVVFANSVFSHLSQSSSLDWGQELARVLRPGGLLVATTLPRKFFDTLEGLKSGKAPSNAWEARVRDIDTGGENLRAQYDRGEFVYLDSQGTGKEGKYGLAFLPEALIRKEWTGLSVVEYLADPPNGLQQAVFVLRKL